MTVIEILALTTMGIVFALAFTASARSHTRAVAWSTPSTHPAHIRQTSTVDGTGTLIDAAHRFDARRAVDTDAVAA